MEVALEKAGSVKTALPDAIKQQLMVLAELSSWCLTDLGSDLNRTKLETLVTVQVHQRDVLGDVTRLFKEKKLQVCGLSLGLWWPVCSLLTASAAFTFLPGCFGL